MANKKILVIWVALLINLLNNSLSIRYYFILFVLFGQEKAAVRKVHFYQVHFNLDNKQKTR